MDDTVRMYATLQDLRTRVMVEKLKDEEITKHSENLRKELLVARSQHAQSCLTADQTQQILLCSHQKANFARETKRRKLELIENVKQLSKDDQLSQQKRGLRDVQSFANSFLKEANMAPWIPEKKELTSELDNEIMELDYLNREIQAVNTKIQERKEAIEMHTRYPFKNFCVSIAHTYHQLNCVRRLIAKEHHINKELKAQLAGRGAEDSYELTQTQGSAKYPSQQSQPIVSQSQQQTSQQLSQLSQQLSQQSANELERSVLEEEMDDMSSQQMLQSSGVVGMLPDEEDPKDSLNSSCEIDPSEMDGQVNDDFASSVNEQSHHDRTLDVEDGGEDEEEPQEDDEAETDQLVMDTNYAIEPTASANYCRESEDFMNALNGAPPPSGPTPLVMAPSAVAPPMSAWNRSDDMEKSGLMTMYNMVNESETSGLMHNNNFFDLFGGGDGHNDTANDAAAGGGKESQESAGGMFNFNFGNASAEEGSGADGSFLF